MDQLYRGYRIAIRQTDRWTARITHVRGTVLQLSASASLKEGPEQCAIRARGLVARYLDFLALDEVEGEPN